MHDAGHWFSPDVVGIKVQLAHLGMRGYCEERNGNQ
jgi:hypothetical protein